jgi:RNA polymerase sigma-70 factor (ECF subfamily)
MIMLLFMTTSEDAPAQIQSRSGAYEGFLSAMASGDVSALERLYAKTKAAVYGYALSILKNRQNAEDVMQDTYIRIFAAAKSYKPQGKPLAWILTITRHFALMKLREQARHPTVPEEELPLTAPGDKIEQSLDRQILAAALAILSDEERHIVILHSVAGLKHREIAALLKLPLSTTLSKYRRALEKLRCELKEDTP